MNPVLIAYDDFSTHQVEGIRKAVADCVEVLHIAQTTPEADYRAALQTAEVVVGWPRAEWLPGTAVRAVFSGSSGWDEYQNRGLAEAGIALCNGRGVYSVGVAEHAVAMMMALVRRIPTYVHDKDARVFRRHLPYTGEIAGTTALVVGLGDIGTEVAKRCKGLGMKVVGVVRRAGVRSEWADSIVPVRTLTSVLPQADHVFLTLPGGGENVNLFSREVLGSMKTTAYLYNLSRGTTVHETALYEALRDGNLAGAGLDVTTQEPLPADSPLWTLCDNVLITGHSAGISSGHVERFNQLVVRNLTAYFSGKPLENRVI